LKKPTNFIVKEAYRKAKKMKENGVTREKAFDNFFELHEEITKKM